VQNNSDQFHALVLHWERAGGETSPGSRHRARHKADGFWILDMMDCCATYSYTVQQVIISSTWEKGPSGHSARSRFCYSICLIAADMSQEQTAG
jgi:hypothetical protein